ncbi:MAG: rhomboid family intramembrane serine protease [Planctomycetes bacterium]|nr:rhomboid family intramembrane serine protease [Planctomycetota bacterium]
MFPLRDNIPSRTVPVVNYLMIGLCAGVFLIQFLEPERGSSRLVERFGMIPARVFEPEKPIYVPEVVRERTWFGGVRLGARERRAAEPPLTPWLTLLTCIFLHGGWMHLLGNLWFLFIFGDNVEDRFGHLGYLIFYLGCGVAASAVHLFTNADSAVPTIGASGAIAGVMGGYFLLYPRAKVLAIVPFFMFLQVIDIPAAVFLGLWFLFQFFQGTLAAAGSMAGGVAWWAHIGGFAAGFAIAFGLRQVGLLREPIGEVLPRTKRITYHRYRPW